MGVCFIRAEAVVSLARAYEAKAPVFEKCITLIDKTGARHRIEAVIGTPLSSIFSQLGIQIDGQDRIIIGGPMQGFATFTPHHPVTPDMDTVLIQDKGDIISLSDTNCVNCGKCIQACPADIPVNLLVRFCRPPSMRPLQINAIWNPASTADYAPMSALHGLRCPSISGWENMN